MAIKMQLVLLALSFILPSGLASPSSNGSPEEPIMTLDDDLESSVHIVHYQPEQVHLAFGESVLDIVVTWNTLNNTHESICEYGIDGYQHSAKAPHGPTAFVDGGSQKRVQYIHRVTLPDLQENTTYKYHCGSHFGWSPMFWFKTPPNHSNWSPSLAIYGDMGVVNAQSLPALQQETQRGMYDAILHVGDFAYDLHDDNGNVGDEFMRQVEAIAAYVPYMVCVGNHESHYNFSHYINRFSMPGGTQNMFYSFDLGPVHFIGFSTEVYYFTQFGIKQIVMQYEWLERDLAKATQPANRAKHPWIITYGHRPMYCSNDNGDDCANHETVVRKGLPMFDFFGLEPLFYKYGVDVEIWAHEHCYERMWPMYNYTIYNGSLAEPYVNPKAPVHIISGAAGNHEGREPFFKHMPPWSAFHSQDFGYLRLKVHNSSHLYFEQVSDDRKGLIIDKFWIVKNSHGAYDVV
ncbi:acid phosphatase type 7 isoform X3 [Scaptodrosophila lebanonensis]|uniref:Purple acid phosphatase n=1 Tax=Drosophila lebanonensis TaxID=7225 RepID=A0A6J2TP75_DROLE|nr:acid phosphatase type 7 isoform X3 [Scaptodrosophila lebanonensis]